MLGIAEARYKGGFSLFLLLHFTVELNLLIIYDTFEGNEQCKEQRTTVSTQF